MSEILDDIIDLIADLLEGSAGDGRTIDAGTFAHLEETELEDVGTQRLSSSPRLFEIIDQGTDDDAAQPKNLAGSHVYGASRLLIRVGYAAAKQRRHQARQTTTRDFSKIRRCLLWAPNRYSVTGWHGTELLTSSGAVAVMDSTDNEEALALEVPIIVSYREDHDS